MKTILSKFLFLFLCVTQSASASVDKAFYFRAWQGFKMNDLNQHMFMSSLPQFMKDTVDIYDKTALNNYLVVIPPENKPDYVPDEFALVALSSKEEYQRIRNTPEGQKYAARHWDLFDRNYSKSADPMIDFTTAEPVQLIHNQSYDMIGNAIDWRQGYNTVYLGLRKPELTPNQFLEKLRTHIVLAKKAFSSKGLKGYIIISNENYEIAFLNWESESAHNEAFQTAAGQAVVTDGAQLFDTLMFETAKSIDAGMNVRAGQYYSTRNRYSKPDSDDEIVDGH